MIFWHVTPYNCKELGDHDLILCSEVVHTEGLMLIKTIVGESQDVRTVSILKTFY